MTQTRRGSVGSGLLMRDGGAGRLRRASGTRARQTTVGGAYVVTRAACAERAPLGLRIEAFHDQLADHLDEVWMCTGGRGADHVETDLRGELLRFSIEIVSHLQVIGDEADRRDDDIRCTLRF